MVGCWETLALSLRPRDTPSSQADPVRPYFGSYKIRAPEPHGSIRSFKMLVASYCSIEYKIQNK